VGCERFVAHAGHCDVVGPVKASLVVMRHVERPGGRREQ
jgi:hypothetical protein